MTRNLTLALIGCLTLTACGTPQEQCISRNTKEYRVVSNLLKEVEANLARGYAWEEREVTRTVWRDCPVVIRNKEGKERWVDRPCLRDITDVERYRVPIDPVVERRKAENLHQRKSALQKQAETAVRACRAAFPEEQRR